jgi:hypothetical protein
MRSRPPWPDPGPSPRPPRPGRPQAPGPERVQCSGGRAPDGVRGPQPSPLHTSTPRPCPPLKGRVLGARRMASAGTRREALLLSPRERARHWLRTRRLLGTTTRSATRDSRFLAKEQSWRTAWRAGPRLRWTNLESDALGRAERRRTIALRWKSSSEHRAAPFHATRHSTAVTRRHETHYCIRPRTAVGPKASDSVGGRRVGARVGVRGTGSTWDLARLAMPNYV